MMEEEGIVVETLGTAAKVRIDKKSACEGCSASFICHPKEHDYVDAVNLIGAVAGQKVKILVRPEVYVKASILLYGLPVLVFLTVAWPGKSWHCSSWVNLTPIWRPFVRPVCLPPSRL